MTLTMGDYTDTMIYAGVRQDFDAWLRRTGIGEMHCFEITFGEGVCFCRCYAKGEDGKYIRRADAPTGFLQDYPEREWSPLDFVEERHQVVPCEEPPHSVLQYLALRDQ